MGAPLWPSGEAVPVTEAGAASAPHGSPTSTAQAAWQALLLHALAWPGRPGRPCPAEATAQPLPRPPSDQPQSWFLASQAAGPGARQELEQAVPVLVSPCPPAFPVSPVSVSTKDWDLPAEAGVLEPRVQPEGLSFAPVAPWCTVSGRGRGRAQGGGPGPEAQGALGLACLQVHGRGFGLGIWFLYS